MFCVGCVSFVNPSIADLARVCPVPIVIHHKRTTIIHLVMSRVPDFLRAAPFSRSSFAMDMSPIPFAFAVSTIVVGLFGPSTTIMNGIVDPNTMFVGDIFPTEGASGFASCGGCLRNPLTLLMMSMMGPRSIFLSMVHPSVITGSGIDPITLFGGGVGQISSQAVISFSPPLVGHFITFVMGHVMPSFTNHPRFHPKR